MTAWDLATKAAAAMPPAPLTWFAQPSRTATDDEGADEDDDQEDNDEDEAERPAPGWRVPVPTPRGNQVPGSDFTPTPEPVPPLAPAAPALATTPSPWVRVVAAARRVLGPVPAQQSTTVHVSVPSGTPQSGARVDPFDLAARQGAQLEANAHQAHMRRRAAIAEECPHLLPVPAMAPSLPPEVLHPEPNLLAEAEHRRQVAAWRSRQASLRLDVEGVQFQRRPAPAESPTDEPNPTASGRERNDP